MTLKRAPGRFIQFVRTTAIGGLLFLLPLIVVGALVGQVVPIVLTIAKSLGDALPGVVNTKGGIALLIVISILLVLFLCFVSGLLARRSWGQKLSQGFEKKLVLLFPRYAILKDQMADTIGGEQAKAQMKPVLVKFDDYQTIGFETERSDDLGLVAVYVPGAPDAWSGRVALVEPERIRPVNADFGEAVASCEQLGRGSADLINRRAHSI